jgi:murein L,D-transpeptidase YcbB/YkuD
MKKVLIIIAVMFFSIYMFGCKKKQVAMEEQQEPMSMEALSTMNATVPTTLETKVPESKVQATPVASGVGAAKLEALPPAGPYKPTNIEIQTALKNAGLYAGEVDGKVGPKTKKAIEEFQKANGLKADGKVGPKTWALLSSHLNPPAESQTKKKR